MRPLRVRAVPVAVVMATLGLLYLIMSPGARRTDGSQQSIDRAGYDFAQHSDSDRPYEDLVNWLLKSGADFSAVSGHARALAGGGRGLFATREIEEGEQIIRIPAECWISHRSILRGSPVAHVLREDIVVQELITEEQTWAVIIGLEYERHNEYSFWKEYLHFMRRQESTIWWSEQELKELHSPKLYQDSLQQQNDIDDIFDRIYPHLYKTYPTMFNKIDNTKESFYWATLTMWGRAFNVAGWNSTWDTEYGIIPIGDLLNHDGGRPSTWNMEYKDPERPSDPTAFVFEANQNTKKGQEIMISYGDHRSSYNFMLYCGFIPNGQTYGDYISIGIYESGELVLEVAVGNDGRIDSRFLKNLVDRQHITKKAAVTLILNALNSMISKYPTTYEDDLAKLNAGNLAYKQWATLTYRVRMKGVYTRLSENLRYLLENGLNASHQKHKADYSNGAAEYNKRKKVQGSADYALDELRIDL